MCILNKEGQSLPAIDTSLSNSPDGTLPTRMVRVTGLVHVEKWRLEAEEVLLKLPYLLNFQTASERMFEVEFEANILSVKPQLSHLPQICRKASQPNPSS